MNRRADRVRGGLSWFMLPKYAAALCIGAGCLVWCEGTVCAQVPLESRPQGELQGQVEAARLLDGLQVFPADNLWNTDVSLFPLHENSANLIASIGLNTRVHPDFGTVYEGAPNGIPFCIARPEQRFVNIQFVEYGNQSDDGPYPVPFDAPIEGGPTSTGDRHVLVVDPFRKKLWELYHAVPLADGSWRAGCGAVFDLTSNKLRPETWTSADAAGLPIYPGLVRYHEVIEKGEINHALRFTVQNTRRAYIHPATHWASTSTNVNRPPMGMRVRLNAGVNENLVAPSMRPVVRCLKKYGMMVADNGGNWFISGAPDPRWNDDDISTLNRLYGRDFEVVYTGVTVTE